MTDWQIGMLAFREGRLREAADRLRAATDEHERTVAQEARFQTYAFLGAALYALGQAGDALGAFQAAVKLCPRPGPPVDLMVNLANAYLATGRRREAREALEQTLQNSPGAMDARLLLERLRSVGEDEPLTGSVLGATTESVQRYIHTLSFSSVAHGYSPDQVQAALGHISHYLVALSSQLEARNQMVTEQSAEIERLRQTEEALIENMMQARQEADHLRQAAANGRSAEGERDDLGEMGAEDSASPLTPLEKLFQNKS